MTIFVTSDLHLGHKTMITCNWRPFLCLEEMHKVIVTNWNKVVAPDDTVYVLGDVYLYSDYKYILDELNGTKIYIKGNHDKNGLTDITNLFINYRGTKIEMVHNPENRVSKKGIVLHGHHHLNGNHIMPVDKKIQFYNVNTEFHKYKPKRLSEILGELISSKI